MNEVLLANDEVTFRETFTKVLQEEGMLVTAVANGKEAIDAIVKQPYPVAILDIQMPGADGIKVLREIMKVRPRTRVIMITAYGTIEMAVEAMKLGACNFRRHINKDSAAFAVSGPARREPGTKA